MKLSFYKAGCNQESKSLIVNDDGRTKVYKCFFGDYSHNPALVGKVWFERYTISLIEKKDERNS